MPQTTRVTIVLITCFESFFSSSRVGFVAFVTIASITNYLGSFYPLSSNQTPGTEIRFSATELADEQAQTINILFIFIFTPPFPPEATQGGLQVKIRIKNTEKQQFKNN